MGVKNESMEVSSVDRFEMNTVCKVYQNKFSIKQSRLINSLLTITKAIEL
jgi:stress-induced morphogen